MVGLDEKQQSAVKGALGEMKGGKTEKEKKREEKKKKKEERKGQKTGGKNEDTPTPVSYPPFTESDIRGRVANIQATPHKYTVDGDYVNYPFSLKATATMRSAGIGSAVLKTRTDGSLYELVIKIGNDLKPAVIEYDTRSGTPRKTTFNASQQTYGWLAIRVLGAMQLAPGHSLEGKIIDARERLEEEYQSKYAPKPQTSGKRTFLQRIGLGR